MKTKDMEIERILDNLFEEQTLKSYADWLCKNSFFEDVIVKYISCIKVISDYYNKTTRKKFFDISNVNTLKEFYKCLPIEYQKSKYKLAYKYYLYWIGEKYPIVDIQKFDIKIGCSVTQRVKQVKQPRGGLLDLKRMQVVKLGEGMECLNSNENVHANLIGLTVDYLTRFMSGTPVDKAFSISILGSKIVNEEKKAQKFISSVKGLDNESIINAVKLSGYDVCYRASILRYRPVDDIIPNRSTVENIRVMVNRSLHFLKIYGPKILDGFTFEGGYTDIICSGDGDFITSDTLWDFKVSVLKPRKEHVLQILIYWRMGLHSIYPQFQSVKYLGIYNPRLNMVYRYDASIIPVNVIGIVEKQIIGYEV